MTSGYLTLTTGQTVTTWKEAIDEPQPAQKPDEPDTSPTHKLCEAVYLDADFARVVRDLFLIPYRVWGPDYGLDALAMMRHVWRARKWQRGRDTALCAVMFLTIAAPAFLLINRGGAALLGLVVALAVLTVLARKIARRHKRVRRIRSWLWARIRRNPHWAVLVVAVLAGMLITPVRMAVDLLNPWDLLVPVGGALAMVVIGTVDAVVATRRATRCRPAAAPQKRLRHQAPALPDDLDEQLCGAADTLTPDQTRLGAHGQVIPYDLAGRSAELIDNGFLGSGYALGDRQIHVDVTQGRQDEDGTRRKPKRVEPIPLHEELENTFRRAAPPGMWCGYRMYADGRSLRPGTAMLPEIRGHPTATLPVEHLLQGLEKPSAFIRTHLCVQLPLAHWSSEIIVTLFARADLTQGHLTLHSDILILPDVAVPPLVIPEYPPKRRLSYVTIAFRLGWIKIWREALLSPRRFLLDAEASARRYLLRRRARRQIRHRQGPWWGGTASIRETLAMGEFVVHPNASQDINGTIAFLMHTLKSGLKRYLEARDIDTSKLEDDVRSVISYQQNKIGQLNAKNVTFGKGRAGDTTHKANAQPSSGESTKE